MKILRKISLGIAKRRKMSIYLVWLLLFTDELLLILIFSGLFQKEEHY